MITQPLFSHKLDSLAAKHKKIICFQKSALYKVDP
jgi:hypothetical protein